MRRVQPLWEQKLKPLDHRLYEMPFKPDGRVPPKERHPLPLHESALNPPPDSARERRNAKDLDGGNRTQPSARCAPHRGSPRCVLWRITGWGYGAGAEKDGRRTTRRETQAWSRHLSLARSYHHPGSRELC